MACRRIHFRQARKEMDGFLKNWRFCEVVLEEGGSARDGLSKFVNAK